MVKKLPVNKPKGDEEVVVTDEVPAAETQADAPSQVDNSKLSSSTQDNKEVPAPKPPSSVKPAEGVFADGTFYEGESKKIPQAFVNISDVPKPADVMIDELNEEVTADAPTTFGGSLPDIPFSTGAVTGFSLARLMTERKRIFFDASNYSEKIDSWDKDYEFPIKELELQQKIGDMYEKVYRDFTDELEPYEQISRITSSSSIGLDLSPLKTQLLNQDLRDMRQYYNNTDTTFVVGGVAGSRYDKMYTVNVHPLEARLQADLSANVLSCLVLNNNDPKQGILRMRSFLSSFDNSFTALAPLGEKENLDYKYFVYPLSPRIGTAAFPELVEKSRAVRSALFSVVHSLVQTKLNYPVRPARETFLDLLKTFQVSSTKLSHEAALPAELTSAGAINMMQQLVTTLSMNGVSKIHALIDFTKSTTQGIVDAINVKLRIPSYAIHTRARNQYDNYLFHALFAKSKFYDGSLAYTMKELRDGNVNFLTSSFDNNCYTDRRFVAAMMPFFYSTAEGRGWLNAGSNDYVPITAVPDYELFLNPNRDGVLANYMSGEDYVLGDPIPQFDNFKRMNLYLAQNTGNFKLVNSQSAMSALITFNDHVINDEENFQYYVHEMNFRLLQVARMSVCLPCKPVRANTEMKDGIKTYINTFSAVSLILGDFDTMAQIPVSILPEKGTLVMQGWAIRWWCEEYAYRLWWVKQKFTHKSYTNSMKLDMAFKMTKADSDFGKVLQADILARRENEKTLIDLSRYVPNVYFHQKQLLSEDFVFRFSDYLNFTRSFVYDSTPDTKSDAYFSKYYQQRPRGPIVLAINSQQLRTRLRENTFLAVVEGVDEVKGQIIFNIPIRFSKSLFETSTTQEIPIYYKNADSEKWSGVTELKTAKRERDVFVKDQLNDLLFLKKPAWHLNVNDEFQGTVSDYINLFRRQVQVLDRRFSKYESFRLQQR